MADNILTLKSCSKCKQLKPVAEFSKSQGKPRAACKACDKSYYQENAERKAAYRAAYYLKNKEKVRERNDAWKMANPDRYKLAISQWHVKNKDQVSEYKRDWSLKNKESLKSKKAKYFQENKKVLSIKSAAWAKNNPEKRRLIVKKARWKNPEPYLFAVQKRRSKIRGLGGNLSRNLRTKLFLAQKGKCACCAKPLGSKYHLDHIMPLALGGTNTDENIQLLRSTCNLQKHAKHPIDFMRERGFLL